MSAIAAKTRFGRAPARLAGCALLALVACGDPSTLDAPSHSSAPVADVPAAPGEARTGTLSFDLRTAGEVQINSFDYVVTGPNFSRAGSIDVSSSSTFSARIDAIPAAAGYSITVTGTSVGEPITKCTGSAGFDIMARTVNNVLIDISCRVTRSVTPPDGTAVPVPRSSTWLVGLALLGIGVTLAKRSRTKRTG